MQTVTVPRLAMAHPGGRLAEWYKPDGSTVSAGEPIFRLEADFVAVEVEAQAAGTLRHRAPAGESQPAGRAVAVILAPGERMPPDHEFEDDIDEPEPAAPAPDAGAFAVAEEAPPDPEPTRAETHPPAARHEDSDEVATAPVGEVPPDGPASPLPLRPRIFRREDGVGSDGGLWEAMTTSPVDGLAWHHPPAPGTHGEATHEPPEPTDAVADPTLRDELALGDAPSENDVPPHPRADAAGPEVVQDPEPEPAAWDDPGPAEQPEPAVHAQQSGASAPLTFECHADITEAAKLREQLAREWHRDGIAPRLEDVVLRAIARALQDQPNLFAPDALGLVVPGARFGRTVLDGPARKSFRQAVAELAAAEQSDAATACTLISYAPFGVDQATPDVAAAEPLAVAMGAPREVVRLEGDHPVRCSALWLVLAYRPGAIDGATAATLLARVRALLEAPYALLAE